MLLYNKIYSEIYKYQTYIYKYSNNSYIEDEILEYLQTKNILVPKLIFSHQDIISPSNKKFKLLIITQYIEGKTLDYTVLKMYEFKVLCNIILQILDIFALLHNNNIIYGDDICNNMIITDSLNVYIIDFGNSCFVTRKKIYHSIENDLRVLNYFISHYIKLDYNMTLKQMYDIVHEACASS